MTTLPLRELVRNPIRVKKLTAAGQSVQITDNGKPLWVVQPAEEVEETRAERAEWIDKELDAVLKEPRSKVSGARLIRESRRM